MWCVVFGKSSKWVQCRITYTRHTHTHIYLCKYIIYWTYNGPKKLFAKVLIRLSGFEMFIIKWLNREMSARELFQCVFIYISIRCSCSYVHNISYNHTHTHTFIALYNLYSTSTRRILYKENTIKILMGARQTTNNPINKICSLLYLLPTSFSIIQTP